MSELATRDKGGIIAMLSRSETREKLAHIVPPGLLVESLISRAKSAILSNPDLLECTEQSLLLAVQKSVSCGLELNGRDCHLVPFYDKKAGCKKAQFIVDVKGYMKLGLESGLRLTTSELVYERDNFRLWTDDAGRHLLHAIDHRQPRGKLLGAFSYVQNASGAYDYEYMSLAEIDAIKARSKASQYGPWVTDENEMRRKTVVRRHSKRWPLGARLAALWKEDDDRLPELPKKATLILPDEVTPALPPPETANLLSRPSDPTPEEEKEVEF